MVALGSRETHEVVDSPNSSRFRGISQTPYPPVGFLFMLSLCNTQQCQVISISSPNLPTEVERAARSELLFAERCHSSACVITFIIVLIVLGSDGP